MRKVAETIAGILVEVSQEEYIILRTLNSRKAEAERRKSVFIKATRAGRGGVRKKQIIELMQSQYPKGMTHQEIADKLQEQPNRIRSIISGNKADFDMIGIRKSKMGAGSKLYTISNKHTKGQKPSDAEIHRRLKCENKTLKNHVAEILQEIYPKAMTARELVQVIQERGGIITSGKPVTAIGVLLSTYKQDFRNRSEKGKIGLWAARKKQVAGNKSEKAKQKMAAKRKSIEQTSECMVTEDTLRAAAIEIMQEITKPMTVGELTREIFKENPSAFDGDGRKPHEQIDDMLVKYENEDFRVINDAGSSRYRLEEQHRGG